MSTTSSIKMLKKYFFMRVIIIDVLIILSTSAQHNTYYVKPNDSQNCSQPCLTLQQYMQLSERVFITGSTFFFLPGNYSLDDTIYLSNVSSMIIAGEGNVNIFYRRGRAIECSDVANLQIRNLAFVFVPNITNYFRSALSITRSRSILIINSRFIGSKSTFTILGAIAIEQSSEVTVSDCIFSDNVAYAGGSLAVVSRSNVTLNGNLFVENQAVYGGAIFANEESVITLNGTRGNTFASNSADRFGGAIYCTTCRVDIVGSSNETENYSSNYNSMAEFSSSSSSPVVKPYHILFHNNRATLDGGAIALHLSQFISYANFLYFDGNRAMRYGGSIFSNFSNIDSRAHLYCKNNSAALGGAIFGIGGAIGGVIVINGSSTFTRNAADLYGGAISLFRVNILVLGRALFSHNYAGGSHGGFGGALSLKNFTRTFIGEDEVVEFINNTATVNGGGIYNEQSYLFVTNANFISNSAFLGGGIYNWMSSQLIGHQLAFINNSDIDTGGGIYSQRSIQLRLTSVMFCQNRAKNGGAMYLEENNAVFHDIIASNNTNAMWLTNSFANITGVTNISGNTGNGGINLHSNSILHLKGMTFFEWNYGSQLGAAVRMFDSDLYLHNTTVFASNTATVAGGGIFAFSSNVTLNGTAKFISNSARKGGAMYFKGSTLTLELYSNLTTTDNFASEYGGAILYFDTAVTPEQCQYKPNLTDIAGDLLDTRALFLPHCFINVRDIDGPFTVTSYNDIAGIDGSFLYGGQLDRCRLNRHNFIELTSYNLAIVPYDILRSRFQIESANNRTLEVTSQPYQLCYCDDKNLPNCSDLNYIINVYRGQKFTFPLIAYAQGNTSVSTKVIAQVNNTASLELNQSTQTLSRQCSDLNYTIYSSEMHEQLTLRVDGPCHDIGLAAITVNVTLRPCPDAFNESNGHCECERRLQVYDVECIIYSDEKIFVKRRTANSRLFWMKTIYANATYQGLILYGSCPPEYCKSEPVEILLDDLDTQCNHHRSGQLCGACASNYSLLLGNSRCQICSNNYLGLLVIFIVAGIALVVFLVCLRMTVAVGLINSIILYANIVQANRNIFFPVETTNILTVFIAWMNLDFGFPICFYNGMDAYAQTWLQFVFPVYIWLIISTIIFVSRYSITVSKLIGHNPIAVLATLILMSYTKILRVIIEVYASVDLEYPNNQKSTVWFKDANVPYLQTNHLLLTIVTSIILVVLFLPYTLFLLIGYKFYRFSGRKRLTWLNKLKPLLDSYYAPYNIQTRYWTGFLLLVRCALYIVFSFNSIGGQIWSLLAINITFALIVGIAHAWFSIKIYKSTFANIIEASVYLNLIILSASLASVADNNVPPLVYSLVGTVFTMAIGIVVYHFHITFTAKSTLWPKVTEKVLSFLHFMQYKTFRQRSTPDSSANIGISSHDPHKIVTQTVIDLREPIMDEHKEEISKGKKY